jgi:cell division protein FtsQ
MSKTGTRRTTIMNRRAGQQARLIYWAKKFGFLAVIVVIVFGSFAYAISSGYLGQVSGRMTRVFHAQMVESGFVVKDVSVIGRQNTKLQALKYIVDIEKGQSIFEPDIDELQLKLTGLTWVKAATVERHLPNNITIHIEERIPIALWQHQGKLAIIDADGVVFSDEHLNRFKDLIILVGEDAPTQAKDLVAMISAEENLKTRVESAKWIGGRRWDLYLKNGVSVKLPEDDLGQAVHRLANAQGEASLMDRNIQSIDLRDPLRIVVQTAPGAVEEYQASYRPQKNI